MNIMDKIRGWMQEEELTYEELATRIGWSRQNLWLKMNKSVCPNFDTVRKIAEAMGHEMTVRPLDEVPAEVNLQDLYAVAEEQQVSFDVIEEMLRAIGYELSFAETQ